MKAVICGAGRYTRNLLGRLGDRWRITLIDASEKALKELMDTHATVAKVLAGDAASPVLLDKAGLGETDYFLALTDNDKVNLAAVRFARKAGVPHILSVLYDLSLEAKFQKLDVHLLLPGNMVGNTLYHYLQDPRIQVFSVARGTGEVVEIEVTRDNWIAGMSVTVLEDPEWRLAGLYRAGEWMPLTGELMLAEGDRLILLGKRNFFRSVCSVLACGHMPFPAPWGRGLMIVLNGDEGAETLEEGMYLLRNTRVGHVSILYDAVDMPDPTAHIDRKNVRHDIRLHPMDGRLTDTVKTLCRKDQIGLVVMRPLGRSFLKSISRPETIALAHELACPLLIARNSNPYDRILVPFNGTAMAALALETAVGLAEQIGALVDAAVVQEPDFIHGESRESWSDKTFKKVREISHIHKVKIGEIECRGNPVKEITALAERYQLMVVGSTNPQKELLTPHVGELLVERTPCSVLILASGAP
ncbi:MULTISPECIES: NAD-binding protein [Desulfococcus]|uniref:TrkA-N domain protein n=1 Tax=Desulfococcus multivorans DSM 2059 TaxID=1121405 RepID=S7TGD0_DESML|nr:NAD-binding protein [Desulfococcus multivorans]AOY59805.1 TrkA5: predicted Trk system potassium NAD-binding peripheral membrane protein [Desulfococcus multivorans]AQV01972.1 hypothetical protein B2D07_15210 [Desulfococcus multivorans]EPR35806.1 TrkA-N domain protein [Desulfococcus multivorans DSM 2059]SJZ33513.1 Trk K+ transport system, NAD-binding component [Desulfococcus multivorans DSM 2059]